MTVPKTILMVDGAATTLGAPAESIKPVESAEQTECVVTSDMSLQSPDAFQTLSSNWVRLEKRKWLVLNGVVGICSIVGWFINGLFLQRQFGLWQWVLLGLIVGLMGMLVWAASFFPDRGFRATTWRLLSHGVEIHRGIWWRHRIFIPRDRIQHTDVHQGPVQRLYGMASLVINTGGTHEPSITLEGIDMPIAESLREQLSRRDERIGVSESAAG